MITKGQVEFEGILQGQDSIFLLPLGSGFIYEVDQAFGWPSGNPRDAVLIFTCS
jgi:hypothetical protein